MWSSRRASAIVAVLALMGLLTSLQTAVAQKEKALVGFKRPPRGDRPYTSPTVATGDPSDLGGLTLTPDDTLKNALQNKIKLAQDNIKVQDWKEAIDALQQQIGRAHV